MIRGLLLLALAVAGISARAEEPDADEEHGIEVTVAPIRIGPHPRRERDLDQEELAWADRALIAPFRERTRGAAWAPAALGFVHRALEVWPGSTAAPELPGLTKEGLALQAQGCADPLVTYLTTWARWLATDEFYGSREDLAKELKAAESLPGSHVLALLIGRDFYHAGTVVHMAAGDVTPRLMALTGAVWQDGGYRPEEAAIFLRQLWSPRSRVFFLEHGDGIWKALKDLGLPPWVAHTVLGRLEVDRAWRSRADVSDDDLTEEAKRVFQEHLGKARELLVKAWQERPSEPWAAAEMIRVAMAAGGEVDETRLWFDRAIESVCDFQPAYTLLAEARFSRWGGSYQHLLGFARACAATGRFETDVPWRIFQILPWANNERTLDYVHFLHRPAIAALTLGVLRGYAQAADTPEKQRKAQGDLALYGWLAGEAKTAADALAACGPASLPRQARVALSTYGSDENALRGDVALLNSPLRTDFLAAEDLRAGKHPADAKAAYEALLPRAEGVAKDRLRGLAGIAGVEATLATGAWATLPADPALSGWIQLTGNWFATPAGFPAIRDADGPVRVVYGARVGPDFEMRATLRSEGEPRARWYQGLVFGDERYRFGHPPWTGAFVRFDKGKDYGTGRIFFRQYVTDLPTFDCPFGDTNVFTVHVNHGKLLWTVNGKPSPPNLRMSGLPEEGRVGLGSFKHTAGITTSLEKLEVRLLPAEKQP